MGLRVIGAGWSRTGTFSLRLALSQLGFGPCYHMQDVFEHPEHISAWRRAAAASSTTGSRCSPAVRQWRTRRRVSSGESWWRATRKPG